MFSTHCLQRTHTSQFTPQLYFLFYIYIYIDVLIFIFSSIQKICKYIFMLILKEIEIVLGSLVVGEQAHNILLSWRCRFHISLGSPRNEAVIRRCVRVCVCVPYRSPGAAAVCSIAHKVRGAAGAHSDHRQHRLFPCHQQERGC